MFKGYSQQTVDVNSGNWGADLPAGSYIKDIYGDFDKFIGTWVWQNGHEKVVFKLEKVTHYFIREDGIYRDFIIGNYSYTQDNGATYVVNTINNRSILVDYYDSIMYSSGSTNANLIIFTFKDVLIPKERCRAEFEFLPNSLNQMKLTLKNYPMPVITQTIDPNPPAYNYNFTIPNHIILTKE